MCHAGTDRPASSAGALERGVYAARVSATSPNVGALSNASSVLGIHSFRDETFSSGDKHSDADRFGRKLAFTRGWVATSIPVALDMTAGYDAHLVFGESADPSYGNDTQWRNLQTQLFGSGIRGVVYDAWNGFTEGWTGMASRGGSWEAQCPSKSDAGDTNPKWLTRNLSLDPRTCDSWQTVAH